MSTARAIGVFDSGVGGISVLKALVEELPFESYVYYGDSANAPYGERGEQEIYELTRAGIERLLEHDVKAIVIACNTATSVAAEELRDAYPELPIVGIEPALKPAVEAHPNEGILVMATPATLSLNKYHGLADALDEQATIIPAPCPGLAARIEQGDLEREDVVALIRELVGGYKHEASAVVLGCTHYPFVARQIREVLGPVELFDGGSGTARQLKRVLEQEDLLATSSNQPSVEFFSSLETDAAIELQRWFFTQSIAT